MFVIHYTITNGGRTRSRLSSSGNGIVVLLTWCWWRPAQNIWHFMLVNARSRFVRILTFEVFMTAQLSHIVAWNICIHQPGNTRFPDAVITDVAFDACVFRCFWEKFSNLVFTQGRFFIPNGIFWLSFVINGEEIIDSGRRFMNSAKTTNSKIILSLKPGEVFTLYRSQIEVSGNCMSRRNHLASGENPPFFADTFSPNTSSSNNNNSLGPV